jgi:hypothetical protein
MDENHVQESEREVAEGEWQVRCLRNRVESLREIARKQGVDLEGINIDKRWL